MKKFTSFALGMMAVFSMSAGGPVPALTLHVGKSNPEVKIINQGKFNEISDYIGFCGSGSIFELGEVDFGANGENFFAAAIDMANGWNTDGWCVLHAGPSWEESVPFSQMALNETGGYDAFRLYASNFTCNQGDNPELWSGGQAAIEGIEYVKPVGKQIVYMSYEGGSGNVRAMHFYDKALSTEDFVTDESSWDYMISLREPDEYDDYLDGVLRLAAKQAVKLNYEEEETPKLDDDQNFWGWTTPGFMVKFPEVDFGNGGYVQMMADISHDKESMHDYLEFYLDEVAPENLINTYFTGRNLGWGSYAKLAKPFNTEIKGVHDIVVVWVGTAGTNLRNVDFLKEVKWPTATECGVVLTDYTPSDDAFHMTFRGCEDGGGNPWYYELKCRGQYESQGNIGYTDNGTVICFYDNGDNLADGIDFGDGSYKTIVVNAACDSESRYEDQSLCNYAFYIDLDPNFEYTTEEQWLNDLETILDGHEPIANVPIQYTGAWGVSKHTAGAITREITGKHELFMVYNGRGANVWDIYLDKKAVDGVTPITMEERAERAADNRIFNLQGVEVANPTVPGIYIRNGKKFIVK